MKATVKLLRQDYHEAHARLTATDGEDRHKRACIKRLLSGPHQVRATIVGGDILFSIVADRKETP